MIRTRRKIADRTDITSQLIRNHDTGFADLRNQPLQKTLGCLGIPPWLEENIKNISVRIHRPPEPAFPTVDRDDDFVQMPFVGSPWPVSPDAICEMAAKAVNPLADSFPANCYSALSKQVFDIGGAECKATVDPDGIGDDLARKTKTLQARHFGRYLHA